MPGDSARFTSTDSKTAKHPLEWLIHLTILESLLYQIKKKNKTIVFFVTNSFRERSFLLDNNVLRLSKNYRCAAAQTLFLGPVHTNADIFETVYRRLHLRVDKRQENMYFLIGWQT